ncbi:unnamed protein product [Leptidea sinapis]|uniref:Uncharacterized protein n=1 Tax=Leptidea sinapis TaxID=189913 RepID=A0A5E4R779_9NEOP|nr:unnamed protein product [Leptidea sinapis]
MSLSYLTNSTKCISSLKEFVRFASKKTGGSTRNTNCKTKPKHRGWKVQDGHFVHPGHILATQLNTRFHPGLNVTISSTLSRI